MHASGSTPHYNDVTGEILFSDHVHRSRVRRPASSVPDKHAPRVAGKDDTAVTDTEMHAILTPLLKKTILLQRLQIGASLTDLVMEWITSFPS